METDGFLCVLLMNTESGFWPFGRVLIAFCRSDGKKQKNKWPCGITYADPILKRMNTHVPPILMFTRGFVGFDPQPNGSIQSFLEMGMNNSNNSSVFGG